ncbi:MAG TPA: DNA polymerase IV [Ferruginibacter sp.]|nr:DNA polymerase IV [Chitinophagaceae bacterium]MBP6046318.1 DNA polymerase IV [Ferruginibacter sp.]NMD28952.1 DNA polymerase IV [Bacteroidota bacterium]MBK7347118.1 DNA polymerase IV [Chitinophagaceae bacterium]MBK8928893.1 DNA polymerase IV [Chitinophagaceae bacterium]
MSRQQRIIAHFDLDSFFVSVEVINNPQLKGKPVIVGGQDRGVVSACSYEARKFGIHSAMPVQKARQLCPQAIFLKGNYAAYGNYSRWVTDIIKAEAPLFEKASVDEFYIDLTGMDKFFNPFEWTITLRNSIIEKTGLPISFGLSANKMMAKIATNLAKPNGYLHIPYGTEKEFLAPLKIGEIPGVGLQTEKLLNSYGISTIQNAFETGKIELENILGKWGADLWEKSQGLHFSKVQPYHEAKSISSENTFDENITDVKFLNAELVRLTEKVCFELRQDGKLAGCVAIKVRFPSFETFTRQATIDPSHADDAFIPVVKELFKRFYKKSEPVRLLGVKLSSFTNNATQANLFDSTKSKGELYKAIDEVKKKFGKYSLKRASSN